MISSILIAAALLNNVFLPEHPNLSKDAPPAWIEEVHPIENVAADSSQKEVQILLYDKQINLDSSEVYIHKVSKVLEGGVESSSIIEIEFDPNYQSIILHRVALFRHGQEVKVLLQDNARHPKRTIIRKSYLQWMLKPHHDALGRKNRRYH